MGLGVYCFGGSGGGIEKEAKQKILSFHLKQKYKNNMKTSHTPIAF